MMKQGKERSGWLKLLNVTVWKLVLHRFLRADTTALDIAWGGYFLALRRDLFRSGPVPA
jgi:hypothetical protein